MFLVLRGLHQNFLVCWMEQSNWGLGVVKVVTTDQLLDFTPYFLYWNKRDYYYSNPMWLLDFLQKLSIGDVKWSVVLGAMLMPKLDLLWHYTERNLCSHCAAGVEHIALGFLGSCKLLINNTCLSHGWIPLLHTTVPVQSTLHPSHLIISWKQILKEKKPQHTNHEIRKKEKWRPRNLAQPHVPHVRNWAADFQHPRWCNVGLTAYTPLCANEQIRLRQVPAQTALEAASKKCTLVCMWSSHHTFPCPFDAGKECSAFRTKGTLFCPWAMWKFEKVEARSNLFCQGGKAVCSYLHCTLQLLNEVARVPAMVKPQLSFCRAAPCPAVLPTSSWLLPPSVAKGWYEVVWIWWFSSEIPLRFFQSCKALCFVPAVSPSHDKGNCFLFVCLWWT